MTRPTPEVSADVSLPSKGLFYRGTIPEPLTEEQRRWLVDQLHNWPKRVNEARTCAIGALTDMAVTEFCRLMAERPSPPTPSADVSGLVEKVDEAVSNLCELHRRLLGCFTAPSGQPLPRRPRWLEPTMADCDAALAGAIALERAKAALAAHNTEAAALWQPIETAPKDDTLFLAGCPDGRIMVWSGRIFALTDERTPRHLSFPATHWMPLPTPPLQQEHKQ